MLRNKIIAILALVTVVAVVRYIRMPHPSEHKVIIGTSGDFPPFSYIDQSGQLVGFDLDLIHELFTRLNREYRVENMPFETLLPAAQFGNIQVIATGMSPTPERAQRIAFSNPYLDEDPMVAVMLANNTTINTLNDLHGKSVAVNQGYTADMRLTPITEINLMRLPALPDALLALKHGKVDAFVTGYRTLKPLQDAAGADSLRSVELPELRETTALGVAKNDPVLLREINEALAALKADGTLAALQEKWHVT